MTLSPGCYLTAEHTYMAAIKVSSQSALIDYTHTMKFKYFKGSLVISSHNNSLSLVS